MDERDTPAWKVWIVVIVGMLVLGTVIRAVEIGMFEMFGPAGDYILGGMILGTVIIAARYRGMF